MRVMLAGAALLTMAAGAAVALAGPAEAASCSAWWPSGGRITADYTPSTANHTYTEFVATATFTFSAAEIQALRCTGSSALEVDVQAYGGLNVGGLKSGSSNLPDNYLDTEFGDSYPRVLTEGSRSAAKIQPGVEYRTQVRLREFTPNNDYAELYLTFQRGHWAKLSSPKEQLSCKGHGGADPAWCIFADESHITRAAGSVPPRVGLRTPYRDATTVSWGSYVTTELRAGMRLGSGDRLYSPNGLNMLVMQADGNLVEYIPGGRAVWASGTFTPGSVFNAQGDGNFVVVAPGNRPVWSTRTNNHPGTVLQLQDDRNLVAYAPGHQAIWANAVAGR